MRCHQTVRVLALWASVTWLAGCGSRPPMPGYVLVKPLPEQVYYAYVRGQVAMNEGDYRRAVVELGEASAAAPDEAMIRVALIRALRGAGDRTEALRVAKKAQERWPDNVQVWLVSGEMYAAGDKAGTDAEQAVFAYEQARKLAPQHEEAYLGLAAAWKAAGKPGRAEVVYRDLIARVPGSVNGHYLLAHQLVKRRAFAKAEPLLRRALQLDPGHTRAHVALARTLRATGRSSESVAILREAFDRSGGSPRMGEELFHQLLDAGERDQAMALLGQLDRDDLDEETRLSFGYLYLEIGAHEAAARVAESVLARGSESGWGQLLKANALGRRRDEAVAVLLEVAAERPAYPSCRALAAELLAQAGDDARAAAVMDEALALYPGHWELVAGRARVHEIAGRIEPARALLQAGLAGRARDPDLLYALAALEDRQGNPARAIELAEMILQDDPESPGALNLIGFSLADRGVDLPRAQGLLLRAMELSPGNALILDSYGWLLFRQGQLRKARRVIERAVHILPDDPELLWHLGEIILAQRRQGRAMELFTRALALDPEPRLRARIDARIRTLGANK